MISKVHSRTLASLIHLCISIIVFSLFILILLTYWYPAPFFSASGGWQGLRIVALIDIVLGPLLTFILFSPKKPKKELTIDLSLVAIMQLLALSWGIYTVHLQRPVAVVFLDYSFYTVPAQELIKENVNLDELKIFGDDLPVYVYVNKSKTVTKLKKLKTDASEKTLSPLLDVRYYSPIANHFSEIYRHNLNIQEIMSANNEMKNEVMELMKNKPDPEAALLQHHYIGLVSRYRNIVLVFDKTNTIIGHLSSPYNINK